MQGRSQDAFSCGALTVSVACRTFLLDEMPLLAENDTLGSVLGGGKGPDGGRGGVEGSPEIEFPFVGEAMCGLDKKKQADPAQDWSDECRYKTPFRENLTTARARFRSIQM